MPEQASLEPALAPDSPFLALARCLSELVFVWRPSGEMLWVNDAFVHVTGMTCEDFKFRNADNPFIHPDDLPAVIERIGAFLSSDAQQSAPIENRFCDAWGHFHALSSVLHKVSWLAEPALLLVSTQKAGAPTDAQAAYEAQRRLMESVGDGVLELSADGNIVFSNRVFQSWLDARRVDVAKRSLIELLASDSQIAARDALAAVAAGAASAHFEATLLDTGRELDVKLSRIEPRAGDAGKTALAIARDITELKKLERSLQHAQRLESIGRLAGGVAHDFNNVLTTISGNLSLALVDLPQTDPIRELLTDAQRATESASTLTKQLLAFSRKQVIAPQVLSLNDVVERLRRMLSRLLGEDIQLKAELAPGLANVRVDPGQLEQILVNLCVNARDAMPNGGELCIRTAEARMTDALRARYPQLADARVVSLTVSDNGLGIPDDVRDLIFEPFFTTKGPSRGTGLGLAMVYGAVEQNGGSIEVESQLGHGTTFTLRFPAAAAPSQPLPAAPRLDVPHGDEHIVLVEDEDAVRTFAVKLLTRLGYHVRSFGSGQEALSALERDTSTIDLLITDVVMPGMNGRALADRMRQLRPGLEVLFTSGYTEHVIEHHGVLDPGIEFLAKPYSIRALAEYVRKLLDKPR